jgi:acetyl-CoA carboxylase biotin carboxyl carrier protein
LDLDKLRELIGIFESSELAEIEIEEEGRRVRLSKSAPAVMHAPQLITHLPSSAPIAMPAPIAPQSGAAPPVAAQPAEPEHDENLVIIESPMVGVFYAQPSPGDPPFVKPGDTVELNQTVCIVEAMKLMNEVTSKFRCTIVNVLVENGEPVEYNQPLFAVRLLE